MHRSEQLRQLVELRTHPLDIRAVEHRTKPIHPDMNPTQKANHVRINCFLQVSHRHGICTLNQVSVRVGPLRLVTSLLTSPLPSILAPYDLTGAGGGRNSDQVAVRCIANSARVPGVEDSRCFVVDFLSHL